MMPDLEGRVAFVTGASRGIGRACVLRLAQAGADVALASRNIEQLAEVAREVETLGRKAACLAVDVADGESIKAGVQGALQALGKVEILVNNAGITRDNLVMRMRLEDWDAVIRTNLSGAYHSIKAVLPGMVRGRWGRIINIASVVAQSGNPGQANYIASKAGLVGLTKGVAAEVASRNITVNAVAPGFIETSMTERLPQEMKQKLVSMIPLGRVGTPADVANAVCFLASDDASYITGHVLHVNGGLYMA